MLGELKESQIETLLYSEVIGRIDCHTDETTYIIPVSYAYDWHLHLWEYKRRNENRYDV